MGSSPELTEARKKELTAVLGIARASKLNGKTLKDFCRFEILIESRTD